MNKKQIIFSLFILAALLSASAGQAAPLFKTNKATIACVGPGSHNLLFAATHKKSDEPLPDACHEIPKDYHFLAFNRADWYYDIKTKTTVKMVYGKDLALHKGEELFFLVAAEDVEPILDASGQMIDDPCSTLTNGEIDQLETDASGRLYMKRYLVTSKCVNGQPTLTTKRLN